MKLSQKIQSRTTNNVFTYKNHETSGLPFFVTKEGNIFSDKNYLNAVENGKVIENDDDTFTIKGDFFIAQDGVTIINIKETTKRTF